MDDLYRSPFTGETLFGGRLAETYKLAKARVDALPHYFHEPSAPTKKSYSQGYNKGGKGNKKTNNKSFQKEKAPNNQGRLNNPLPHSQSLSPL